MIKYFILATLMALALMQSCSKNNITVEEDPCPGCIIDTLFKNIDTLWSVDMPGEFGVPYKGIFSEGDLVIFVGEYENYIFVTAYNKQNGEKVWEWLKQEITYFHITLDNGVLVLQNLSSVIAIDARTGILINEYISLDEDLRHYGGFVLGDYFYHSRGSNNDSLQTVLRTHVSDFENWETIYTINRGEDTGGSSLRIESFNLWIDPATNDEILLMQYKFHDSKAGKLVAWNLTKGEIEWEFEDFIPNYKSNPHQILVENNKAFFTDGSKYYCFDMSTGGNLWQFEHPSGTYPMLHLQATYANQENALIVKDDFNGLISIDASTGNMLWMEIDRGDRLSVSGSPVYHDGIVYYMAEWKLWAADAENGDLLLSQAGNHNITQSFRGDIAIDYDRSVIYTSTRRNIYAIKTIAD